MGLNLFDIVIWWLILELIGLLALPIAVHCCPNLRDSGYSISKPLGLLILTYISWIISSFTGYSPISLFLALLITGMISLIILAKRRKIIINKKYVLTFEIIFFIAFLIFAIIRAYSPDIYWTGGEKFMDITFINSILRTTEFPPPDPWMSGTVTYYYYFGYLIVANLISITGLPASIAFNLATASFFALSFTIAAGIGFNLTGRMKFGFLTGFLVTIAGNPVGFIQLMDTIRQGNTANAVLSFNYWTSSRVIPDTINEFPFFSFLQGDVHPQMISITFQLLVLLLLLNIMRSRHLDWNTLLITGLSIGFLYPLNTWDYPVYLIISILVICSNMFSFIHPVKKQDYIKYSLMAATIAVSSYLLYLPYHLLSGMDKTISMVPSGRTSLIFYIAFYGIFLILICLFLMQKARKNLNINVFRLCLIILSIVVLVTVLEAKLFVIDKVQNPAVNQFELLMLLIPVVALTFLIMQKENDRNNVFILILIIAGAIVSIFCEFFYIEDALGNANPALIRLNTVFKLYLQTWILWGISTGYIVFLSRNNKSIRIAAALLILAGSVYPIFATIGKSGDFAGIPDLDGEAYVGREHPQDYQAILWFRNISSQPVVLQAPGELYKWNAAVTAFTGLPTIIGWAGHELNWRFPERSEVDKRWSDAGIIYTSSDIREVDALLMKYNVSYIYFGEAEAKQFGRPRLFEERNDMFEKMFEYGDVKVFKLREKKQ